jgi:hypothetical protein
MYEMVVIKLIKIAEKIFKRGCGERERRKSNRRGKHEKKVCYMYAWKCHNETSILYN